MKKKLLFVCGMLAAVCVLGGCAQFGFGAGTAKYNACYAATAQAGLITQEITVTKGSLEVYLSEKTFEKTDAGYEMTAAEKILNQADGTEKEPYTVTETTETLPAAETFVPALKLSTAYFEYGYEEEEDSFRATVREGMEDAVFGLTEQHAPMTNVTLALTLEDDHLTSLKVEFLSGLYSVSILITYGSYPAAPAAPTTPTE